MQYLSNMELINISGGAIKPVAFLRKFYRFIKIKILMKKVFID